MNIAPVYLEAAAEQPKRQFEHPEVIANVPSIMKQVGNRDVCERNTEFGRVDGGKVAAEVKTA